MFDPTIITENQSRQTNKTFELSFPQQVAKALSHTASERGHQTSAVPQQQADKIRNSAVDPSIVDLLSTPKLGLNGMPIQADEA